MKTSQFLALATVLVGLAACSAPETATRQMPSPVLVQNQTTGESAQIQTVLAAQYDVEAIEIIVPRSLTVSEANVYVPKSDIVWRGDLLGDRHAQVKAIFEAAFAAGTATMTKGPRVKVVAQITSFHCLTEKTRYTIGGNHHMRYTLTVIDMDTGAVLQGPWPVIADVKASGGKAALAEDAAGRTQKVVVTERLAQSIRRELSKTVALEPGQSLVSRNSGEVLIVSSKTKL
jgi:hypothetical protein